MYFCFVACGARSVAVFAPQQSLLGASCQQTSGPMGGLSPNENCILLETILLDHIFHTLNQNPDFLTK